MILILILIYFVCNFVIHIRCEVNYLKKKENIYFIDDYEIFNENENNK